MVARWEKQGLLFTAHEFARLVDWSDGFTQAPNAVVEGERVRVYFTVRSMPDEAGMVVSRGAFVEFDDLDKPLVVDYSENPILNLGGLGCFDEFGTYPISVYPHEGKYYAYYGGWTRCQSVPFDVAVGLATSQDGRFFERIGTGPILSRARGEPFVITSPKIRRFQSKWVMAYTAGKKWFLDGAKPEIVYKIRIAFSEDGVNWVRDGRDIISNVVGPDEAQASPDITFSNGRFHMFFCYRRETDFRDNPDRAYRIGYANSANLLDWTRDDSLFPILPSDEGWDSVMVAYPSVFAWKGRTFMLYLGNDVGRDGVGLAELKGGSL